MSPVLISMAERYVLNTLLSGDFPFNRSSRTASWLRLIAGVLCVTGTGFLVAAMYYWLNANYDPQTAALIAAGGVFALAALAVCVSMLIAMERRSRLNAMKEDVKKNIAAVFETLDEELGQPVREHPLVSVLLASVAGYAVTDRIL